MPFLTARSVKKSYHGNGAPVAVLHQVDLSVEQGEFVTIFGTSGSGKSTLLHILGGLDRPTDGEVCVASTSLYRQNEAALAAFRNRQVGFVFQFYHLLPEFTAMENVMLPCLIGGRRRAEATDRAQALMAEVGLSHRLHHHPRELSGGEQQRVAIARALVQAPPLLLADEPTGNLDATIGNQVIALLQEIWAKRHMTIVMVTHNPDLIRGAERRCELKSGRLHEIV